METVFVLISYFKTADPSCYKLQQLLKIIDTSYKCDICPISKVVFQVMPLSCFSLNLTFLAPTFPASPPWLNKDVDIDISLQELISKKNDNPELLRLISLEHINKYNTYTNIYTDGSKAENLVAAAYTIPTLNLNKQFRLCNSSSIYAAELTAIRSS